MFCINCGSKIADDAKFCPNCGTRVGAEESPFAQPAETPAYSSGSEQNPYSSDYDSSIYGNNNDFSPAEDLQSAPSEDPYYSGGSLSAASDDDIPEYDDTVYEVQNPDLQDGGAGYGASHHPAFKYAETDSYDDFDDVPMSETPPPVEENSFSDSSDIFASEEPAPVMEQPAEEPYIPAFSNDSNATTYAEDENTDSFDTVHIPSGEMEQPFANPVPEPQPVPQPFEQPVQQPYEQQFAPTNEPAPVNYAEQPVQQPQFAANGGLSAPTPMPAPMPVPEAAAAAVVPSKRKKVGGGRIFGASIVAFFAIILLFLLSIAVCLKFGASPTTLKKRVEKLNKTTVLSADFENDEMSNNIFKSLGFRSVTHGNVDEGEFRDYLAKSNMLEFIGENVENYARYIMEGKGKDPSLTAEDIKTDFFKANNDVADEVFDFTFEKEELNTLESRMEDKKVDETLSVKKWNKKAGFNLKNVSYGLSYVTLGVVLALIIVFFIWIAIIVDRRGRHVMGFFGNIFFISGLLTFIVGLAAIVGCAVGYAITSNIIFYLVPNVLLWFGVLALGTGFGELLLGIIFKKVKRNLKAKAKAKETAQQEQNPVPAYN